jgi:hypothetical protein
MRRFEAEKKCYIVVLANLSLKNKELSSPPFFKAGSTTYWGPCLGLKIPQYLPKG